MAGASAVTARYTPMNHNGWQTSFVALRNTRESSPSASSTNANGTHAARRIATGFSSRAMREATNSVAPCPLRRRPSTVSRLENPPTKKKIGITWNAHVRSQSPDVTPTALVDRITPPSQWLIEMNQ